MMKRLTPLAVAALLAMPAFAQPEGELPAKIGEAQQAGKDAKTQNNSNEARAKRVIGNIACVGDADVSAVVDAARDKATIEFAKQAEPSKRAGTKISLNETLPDYPRVQIAYVVKEAAPLAYETFPDSVEKEYMTMSLAVRGWLELGGEPSKLPKLETLDKGYSDAKLGGDFSLWIGSTRDSYQDIKARSKSKQLISLIGDAKTEADREKYRAAYKVFDAFLKSETEWLIGNAFRLQQ
jgi:hypothetical protein